MTYTEAQRRYHGRLPDVVQGEVYCRDRSQQDALRDQIERGRLPYMLEVFTDGAMKFPPGYRGNGYGGWAYLIRMSVDGEVRKEKRTRGFSGAHPNATAQSMELTAGLMALQSVKTDNTTVLLTTDSQYMLKSVCFYSHRWEAKGWPHRKNIELLQGLVDETSRLRVGWIWTRGHAGHTENEIVDGLARQSAIECLEARSSEGSHGPTCRVPITEVVV